MKKNPAIRVLLYTATVLLSVIGTLLVLEIGLRLVSTKFRVVPEMMNVDTSGDVHRRSEVPGLVYEMIPGSSSDYFCPEVRINKAGFRDDEFILPKPVHTFRIASIGDSITFGLGNTQHENYSFFLERMLNEKQGSDTFSYEVMNMGVCGYNALQELIVLRERTLMYEPDAVIVGWLMDDCYPSVIPRNLRYIDYLLLNASYLFRFIDYRIYKRRLSASGDYLHQFMYHGAAEDQCEKVVRRTIRLCRDNRIPLLYLLNAILEKNPRLNDNSWIKGVLEEEGTPYLEMYPVYLSTVDDIETIRNTSTDPSHPNPKGHMIIAGALLIKTRELGWYRHPENPSAK